MNISKWVARGICKKEPTQYSGTRGACAESIFEKNR